MKKALHQALYDAIRLRNKFCKMPPKENEKLYRNEEMSQFEKKNRNYSNKLQNKT